MRRFADRFIHAAEQTAGGLLALVTALTFVSVVLRYVFSRSIPDSYDLGRNLLGILIFWGISVASYRGDHITVDLLWGAVPPRARRWMGLFATAFTFAAMAAFCWATALKVIDTRNAGETTYDVNLPIWPFYLLAWIGTLAAVVLVAVRLAREWRSAAADSPAPLPSTH
jgi:TRAP-type C4-dicarboxylate transport system permease small subunit